MQQLARVRAYLNAGIDPNKQSGNDGQGKRESKRARIECDFAEARQIGGSERNQKTQSGIGDTEGEHAADELRA